MPCRKKICVRATGRVRRIKSVLTWGLLGGGGGGTGRSQRDKKMKKTTSSGEQGLRQKAKIAGKRGSHEDRGAAPS